MNGEPSDYLQDDLVKLGTRLRRLRKEHGWRLEDLAERTGFSAAYLSRLEKGDRQASLSALIILARAYGVTLNSLFEPEPETGNLVVVRASSRPVRQGNGLFYSELSTGSWTFNVRPMRIVVPAQREEDVLYKHEGEQWLYVLSGRLSLKLGEEETTLVSGDAAHFDADEPHQLAALDGHDAELILVACAIPYLLLRSYL
jgi:transcriptional regulator with XRE-family HTH domain